MFGRVKGSRLTVLDLMGNGLMLAHAGEGGKVFTTNITRYLFDVLGSDGLQA